MVIFDIINTKIIKVDFIVFIYMFLYVYVYIILIIINENEFIVWKWVEGWEGFKGCYLRG